MASAVLPTDHPEQKAKKPRRGSEAIGENVSQCYFFCTKCLSTNTLWEYKKFDAGDRYRARKVRNRHSSKCKPKNKPETGSGGIKRKASSSPLLMEKEKEKETEKETHVLDEEETVPLALLASSSSASSTSSPPKPKVHAVKHKAHLTCQFCDRVNQSWYYDPKNKNDLDRAKNARNEHQKRHRPGQPMAVYDWALAKEQKVSAEIKSTKSLAVTPTEIVVQEPPVKRQRTTIYPRVVPDSFRCHERLSE